MFHRPKTDTVSAQNQAQDAKDKEADRPAASLIQETPAVRPDDNTESTAAAAEQQPKTENKIEETKTEVNEMNNEQKSAPPTQSRPLDIPGSATFQQRTAQAVPGRVPGAVSSYPGSLQGSSKAEEGRRLVISEGITISGEIAACDHLVIEGTVEAALKGARALDVSETGTFYGSVEIEEATIAGRFEGEITVNGRLTVQGTGTVIGSISYKELEVESGATIDGKISPLTSSRGAEKSESPKESKKSSPRNDNAGARAELPFEGSTAAAAE